MHVFDKLRALFTKQREEGWALVLLRLMVGYGFAAHGYAKLARGPDHFATILSAMGVPAPGPMAWLTSLVELAGGIGIMLGVFVALLSVPLIVVMLTAMIGVHLRYGFSSVRLKSFSVATGAEFGPVGYELSLLYIVGLMVLALGPPSALSVDRWLARRRRSRVVHGEVSPVVTRGEKHI
jgi:putative oxidoreductase